MVHTIEIVRFIDCRNQHRRNSRADSPRRSDIIGKSESRGWYSKEDKERKCFQTDYNNYNRYTESRGHK